MTFCNTTDHVSAATMSYFNYAIVTRECHKCRNQHTQRHRTKELFEEETWKLTMLLKKKKKNFRFPILFINR